MTHSLKDLINLLIVRLKEKVMNVKIKDFFQNSIIRLEKTITK